MTDSAISATNDHIVIVGGGLVGASLAIALDAAGRAVTLVEATAPQSGTPPSYDERNLALARATVNGLNAIGVWPLVCAQATPIRHIQVTRAGEFGSARLDAARQGIEALGWTLPARELGQGLLRRLEQCTRLTRIAPGRVGAIQAQPHGWRLSVEAGGDTHQLDAALLVGADGTDSQVRAQLGIEADRHDYGQTLFVCTVMPERELAGRAFERFSDQGPVALLPLAERRAGLVLTVPNHDAADVAALDDDAYLALAQQRLGWSVGRLQRPGKRHAYPIARVAARQLIAPHAVLVGNAAQTIHPIGAQGFNLGLRDALTLAEMVVDAADPGSGNLLSAYAARRAPDRDGTMAMSHNLVRFACMEQPWLAPLRSAALLAFDRLPPLRQALARRGMGFRGQPPRAVLEPSA